MKARLSEKDSFEKARRVWYSAVMTSPLFLFLAENRSDAVHRSNYAEVLTS